MKNKKAGYILLCMMSTVALSTTKPIIDKDIFTYLNNHHKHDKYLSLLVFFKSKKDVAPAIAKLKSPNIHVDELHFMPVVVMTGKKDYRMLTKISHLPFVRHIALNQPAGEKIEISPDTEKPKRPFRYPGMAKWWAKNFKGQSGIIGLIDSGIAPDHPALIGKRVIINKSEGSGYDQYPNGVRSPHGTGVACIYAGYPLGDELIRGVSYKAPIILSSIAGEGSDTESSFWLTYTGLNWIFSLNPMKPSVINYSFGNGNIACASCPDWSGMAKVVDYIVNNHKIMWVTSAGNNGFIKPRKQWPYTSTMTIPADNYNALTVANMNMYIGDTHAKSRRFHREHHAIRFSSSRGPTRLGRKKPDITAPGNNTVTCAPNPEKYHIDYTHSKSYEKGYRLMGGTSSAAPHVGGAILLMHEAEIVNPIAIKALLINSADTWTDSGLPGPHDPEHRPYKGGHHPQVGSEWNPTYGWGYINMSNALNQRKHLIENELSVKQPVLEYKMNIYTTDKITVVHERRVGFNKEGNLWQLSHLKLELIDAATHQVLAQDDSSIDNVHQVSICSPKTPEYCVKDKTALVLVRLTLLSPKLEGARTEPFALVYTTKSKK